MDPNSKSALEYSRDGQAPVLHAIEGIYMIISQGLFRPDESRAQAMEQPCMQVTAGGNELSGTSDSQSTTGTPG